MSEFLWEKVGGYNSFGTKSVKKCMKYMFSDTNHIYIWVKAKCFAELFLQYVKYNC